MRDFNFDSNAIRSCLFNSAMHFAYRNIFLQIHCGIKDALLECGFRVKEQMFYSLTPMD